MTDRPLPNPFGRTLFTYSPAPGIVHLETAPGQYICDFCASPDPTWQYPCGPVRIFGNPAMDATDDDWAACDACHELIETGDVTVMITPMVKRARAQPHAPYYSLPPLGEQLFHQRLNLVGFLKARTGPATRIQETKHA